MKKITYLSISIILVLFLNNCGYKPIYGNKNVNIKIVKHYIKGNNELSQKLYTKLNEVLVLDEMKSVKDVTAEIFSFKNKLIMTKDSTGKALSYKITIGFDLVLTDTISSKVIINESVEMSEIYKVKSQGYQTDIVEEKVMQNLIERSAQDFLLKISQSS